MENFTQKTYKHKMHFCIFCKKEITRLAEHFIRRHKDEDVVREILATKNKKKKQWRWKTLRQQGDHLYNTMENVGDRKIVKAPHRPSKNKKYFDCTKCMARLRTTSKLQQESVCKKMFKADPKPDMDEVNKDIFDGLPEDLINEVRKSTYITTFLKQMFEARENHQVLRTMARDIIKLEKEVQENTGRKKPLSTFLTSNHVDDVIRTVKLMSGPVNKNEGKLMRYPYRAQRICHMISHFSKFLTKLYSKKNLDQDIAEITKFQNNFKSDSEKLRTTSKNQHQKVCKSTLEVDKANEDVLKRLPEDLINEIRQNRHIASFLKETYEIRKIKNLMCSGQGYNSIATKNTKYHRREQAIVKLFNIKATTYQ